MLLAADIGNTNITLGVFDNNHLIETFRIDSDKSLNQSDYINKLFFLTRFKIDACVIVSVVEELNQVFKSACDSFLGVNSVLFSSSRDFDMKIVVKNPQTVGADRLVNAFAARKYVLPAIVVDIGTAITFDVVSKKQEFLGGIIMPGVNLQFQSLNLYTSKLPLVMPRFSPSVIGDCTENAILSGVIRGTAASIEGLIKQCEKELGEKATVIATGGQCELVAEYLERKFDFLEPNLTLEGLRELSSLIHVNLY